MRGAGCGALFEGCEVELQDSGVNSTVRKRLGIKKTFHKMLDLRPYSMVYPLSNCQVVNGLIIYLVDC